MAYQCEWCGRSYNPGGGYSSIHFCSESCYLQAKANPDSKLNRSERANNFGIVVIVLGLILSVLWLILKLILTVLLIILVASLFTPSILLFSALQNLANIHIGCFAMWIIALILSGIEFVLYYFISNKNIKSSIITYSVVHILLIITTCIITHSITAGIFAQILAKMLPFIC